MTWEQKKIITNQPMPVVWEVSTAHVEEEDTKRLAEIAKRQALGYYQKPHDGGSLMRDWRPLEVHDRGDGFLVAIPPTDLCKEEITAIFDGLEEFSPLFEGLIRIAMFNGYRWILLDCDAEKYDGLEQGEWAHE